MYGGAGDDAAVDAGVFCVLIGWSMCNAEGLASPSTEPKRSSSFCRYLLLEMSVSLSGKDCCGGLQTPKLE